MLRRKHGCSGEDFSVHECSVADVFPERPGKEIVAIFGYIHSDRILRIYDLRGEMLYQVWHDGALGPGYWMSRAGLLVLAGFNSEAYWRQRTFIGMPDPYPRVLFALQPVLGFLSNEYVTSTPGDGPLNPRWHKCLQPPEALDLVDRIVLARPPGQYSAERYVQYEVGFHGKTEPSIGWTIGELGDEVSRVVNDGYKRNLDELPDPNLFQLGPMPPIESSRQEPARNGEQE